MLRFQEQIPERAHKVGQQLLSMLLASVSELQIATGLSEEQAGRGAQDLINAGLAASVEVGCLLPGVPHLWLTTRGLDYFGASAEQRSWHEPAGVGSLILYDLPKIEAVNAIATRYPTGELTLSGISYYAPRKPMFAVAEYCRPKGRNSSMLFCWVSIMETQAQLFHHLEELPEGTQEYSRDPNRRFKPDVLCLVAADHWGAAQAVTMACVILRDWLPPTNITAWYPSDGSWQVCNGLAVSMGVRPNRLYPLLPPIGALRPAPSVRKLGKRSFEGIIAGSPWTGRAGQTLFRLLTAVGEYPVTGVALYKAFVGEGRKGKETKARLKKLKQLGLVKIVYPGEEPKDKETKARLKKLNELGLAKVARKKGRASRLRIAKRGRGADRYVLTKRGRAVFCLVHGGLPADLDSRTRTRGFTAEHWHFSHEDGLYETLAQFFEMGCSVASGWRARVTLADGSHIYPDGIVLVETQWGRMWSYLEFELSDRSSTAVTERCERYCSVHRLDDRPLLVVCYDDRAERNFHLAGAANQSSPLRMLTTTLRRLKDAGVAGDGVWSYYGQATTITAP